MADDKPFKTIEEQIEILRGRGMVVEDNDRETLIREGYYSIVNGYKDAFIDRQATSEAGEDRYLPGTTFEQLRLLFNFDRMLREETFPLLVRAETTFRTALAYSFSDKNRVHDAYLNPASYCAASQYHSRGTYERDKAKLLRILNRAHDNKWGHVAIDHYLSAYGHVPLWVLVNVLTFGNVSHLYALSTISVRNETCRMISEVQGNHRIGIEELRKAISTLVSFRNICAHDDRLYCARVGLHGERSFADMVDVLGMLVDSGLISNYIDRVSTLLTSFDVMQSVQAEVLGGMHMKMEDGALVRA